jgi:hypothetical protein
LAQAWSKYSVEYPSGILCGGWRVQLCSTSRSSTTIAGPADPASSTKCWGIADPAASTKRWEPANLTSSTQRWKSANATSSASCRGQPVQLPLQGSAGPPIQQPNPYQPTYGELAFGSPGVPPNSTYKIAPACNRLQKNIYGGGYHEVMDYGAIDALPNPGYGEDQERPSGRWMTAPK